MKLLCKLALLLLPLPTLAQQITITGTVKDASGNPFVNGTGRAILTPLNVSFTTGLTNPVPGSQSPVTIAGLDAFGHFSVLLTSTAAIDQQSSNPQWMFTFCSFSFPNTGPICFSTNPLTLTSSQDISAQIAATPPPALPVVPNPASLSGNNPFTGNNTHSGTETFTGPTNLNNGGAFSGTFSGNHTLTGNVTVTGPFVCKNQLAVRCVSSANGTTSDQGWSGTDVGGWINSAYADLPSTGGRIRVAPNAGGAAYSYSTPIVFGTNLKPVVLEGDPAFATSLSFTATSGIAIALDWGVTEPFGAGIRDMKFVGPGTGTTVGLQVGVTNGAETVLIDSSRFLNFATGLNIPLTNSFLFTARKSAWSNNVQNVIVQAAAAVEGTTFDHCLFSNTSPANEVNSVQILGGDVSFIASSFDSAQLSVVNAVTRVVNAHFENPNFDNYDYMNVNTNTHFELIGANILQDKNSSPQAQIISLSGNGSLSITGGSYFSSAQQTHFINITSGNPSLYIHGFADLSNNYSSTWIGGSTTGTVVQLPNPRSKSVVYGAPGDGAAPFHVIGNSQINGTMLVTSALTSQGNFVGQSGVSIGTLTNAAGLQMFNTGTSCTTAASVGSTCTTANITLPVTEPDSSYHIVCFGRIPTNVPVVTTATSVSSTQFTITIAALTAAAATFSSYDCIVGHN